MPFCCRDLASSKKAANHSLGNGLVINGRKFAEYHLQLRHLPQCDESHTLHSFLNHRCFLIGTRRAKALTEGGNCQGGKKAAARPGGQKFNSILKYRRKNDERHHDD